MNNEDPTDMKIRTAIVHAAAAVAAFHLAYHWQAMALMIVFYLFSMASLLRLGSGRQAFYFGLAIGFGVYAPPLEFFWTVFGPAAIGLWLVLAFWHGLFLLLARKCRVRFGWQVAVLLLPFLWTGIEYFRCEVYHLRFSWLSAGFAFADSTLYSPFRSLGVYGIGFVLMTLVSGILLAARFRTLLACGCTILIAGLLLLLPDEEDKRTSSHRTVRVAGIQMEFPLEQQLLYGLDELIDREPDADLIVLSEYSFDHGIPQSVKDWCKEHQKHLIAGGRDETSEGQFYNTAFVVDPSGEIVFQQAKSVPIQFFQDGLPAAERRVWDSPWGKLGIGICYDLSYRNVMDEFVSLGAEALIIPTMDVQDWGQEQHELHARVAPMRSMEYGLPILRLASSGISQLTGPRGAVIATAPYPGQYKILAGELALAGAGAVPVDRILAPLSYAITLILGAFLVMEPFVRRLPLPRSWRIRRGLSSASSASTPKGPESMPPDAVNNAMLRHVENCHR